MTGYYKTMMSTNHVYREFLYVKSSQTSSVRVRTARPMVKERKTDIQGGWWS